MRPYSESQNENTCAWPFTVALAFISLTAAAHSGPTRTAPADAVRNVTLCTGMSRDCIAARKRTADTLRNVFLSLET